MLLAVGRKAHRLPKLPLCKNKVLKCCKTCNDLTLYNKRLRGSAAYHRVCVLIQYSQLETEAPLFAYLESMWPSRGFLYSKIKADSVGAAQPQPTVLSHSLQ